MKDFLLSRQFWWVLALPLCWPLSLVLTTLYVEPTALGPDPAQALVDEFGKITLYLLILVLGVTPVVRRTGWVWLAKQRRALGVSVFGYGLLHWLAYAGLLLEWRWQQLGQDLLDRPYIIVGFVAGVMLLALAVTSNTWSVRRLGSNWRRLHRLIYPAVALSLAHVFWVARSDYSEVLAYTVIVIVLLALRRIKSLH